ncbi:hypothetical protein [Polyangium sp. 15x6]|uniref:hypothetical protein n=1 Tax=Polyangium sp. 15x6 TaxID=3042687 RepID=UPI00249A0A57|nr:hypothetical protein [Polyangium sp. 15x6]MDI3291612.1 hypothetical protein [Polyangium sp. 15x6]
MDREQYNRSSPHCPEGEFAPHASAAVVQLVSAVNFGTSSTLTSHDSDVGPGSGEARTDCAQNSPLPA